MKRKKTEESTASDPKFMRLPRVGHRDPLFGLTRSYINALVLPGIANGFHPPVKSYVIRRPGARTGVRLVNVQSLTEFILRHEQRPDDIATQLANAKAEIERLKGAPK